MKLIAAGNTSRDVLKSLEREGFDILLTEAVENVLSGLKYHPDMQVAVLNGKAVCEPSVYDKYKKFISSSGAVPVKGKTKLNCNYPGDVAYNISVVSNYVFHNVKYTDPEIINALGDKILVNTAQGYSGCSICNINEGALITADMSVYTASVKNNIDCLLISPGNIHLEGFNYGFIGGASFFYGETLYTFGNLKSHPDCDSIRMFCKKHKTRICELSGDILSDYGSAVTFD